MEYRSASALKKIVFNLSYFIGFNRRNFVEMTSHLFERKYEVSTVKFSFSFFFFFVNFCD